MNPDRYQQIKEIFLAAADLESGERAAYLDDACAEDKELRSEVESLLAEHEKAAISEPTIKTDSIRSGEDLPPSIGPYRIVSQIGRGGMGVVYLGVREDGQFKRRVAIKVVKKGMDTEEILARFDLERQLLASLNHANIARLYEGDVTEDGRPYFVLEFIDGVPIDQYCDEHRLTIKERLGLFATVCEAVQYAHQNLVVHRDIKPGNILVTGDGTPKLLDFGIAKLLNPELSLLVKDPTAPALRLMTPEYASPEQVRGTTITTASDVYSLGVLLYELLTGHRPYRITSHIQAELERIICEVEPERPSTAINQTEEIEEEEIDRSGESTTTTRKVTPDTVSRARGGRIDRLRKQLAGDLDNIVFMAMRKEPQRRYSSAKQLAEDIQRHLNSLPVIARPDNLPYRFRKFMTRNRGPVAAAAIIVLLLSGGIVGTSWAAHVAALERDAKEQARQAEVKQRERAEQFLEEAMSLSDFFMNELSTEIDKRGAANARKMMADRALSSLQSLSIPAETDKDLARKLGNMYVSVGDIQGGPRNGNIGDHEGALESYQKALSLRRELLKVFSDDVDLQTQILLNHIRICDVLRLMDRQNEAITHWRLAMDLYQNLPESHRTKPEYHRLKAIILQSEGDTLRRSGEFEAAITKIEESLRLRKAILKDIRTDANVSPEVMYRAMRDVSTALGRQSDLMKRMQNYEEAKTGYELMLFLRAELVSLEPTSRRAKRDYAVALQFLARTLDTMGSNSEAIGQYERHRVLMRELTEEDPSDARTRRDYALATFLLGDFLFRSKKKQEAKPLLEDAVILYEALLVERPDNQTVVSHLLLARKRLASIND